MEFNEKLQQLRTGKNLTQEQLADVYKRQMRNCGEPKDAEK